MTGFYAAKAQSQGVKLLQVCACLNRATFAVFMSVLSDARANVFGANYARIVERSCGTFHEPF